MAQKLYALLVGINDYPDGNQLKGCENDVEAMKEYLKGYYPEGEDADTYIRTLVNTEANRENIIAHFLEHFRAAGDGDMAFFYYSGHGDSFNRPPQLFDPGGSDLCQSLVCHYAPGKRVDIADKELGAMIHDVTTGKDVFFLAITDCCHSGTITRNDEANTRAFKNETGAPYTHIPLTEYYGYNDAEQDEHGQYVFKRGKNLHIASCRDNESSIETTIKRKWHGVFTCNMLQLLQRNKGEISYADLEAQSGIVVNNIFREQHSRINDYTGKDTSVQQRFLGSKPVNLSNAAVINFVKGSWRLNRGMLHNMSPGDRILLKEGSNGAWDAEVEDVGLNHAILRIRNTKLNNKEGIANIPVLISETAQRFMELKLQAVVDEVRNTIRESGFFNTLPYYKIIDEADAQYYIGYSGSDKTLFFGHSAGDAPLLAPVPLANAGKLLVDISKYSKAMYIRQMNSTMAGGPATAVSIRLFIKDSGEEEFRAHLNLAQAVQFNFNPAKPAPQYKIKISNKGSQVLFVQHLFIDCLCGIRNNVFNEIELSPGAEAWLRVAEPGMTLSPEISEIYLTESILNRGWKEAEMQLKLFITTKPLGTAAFTQQDMDADTVQPQVRTRGADEEWELVNIDFVIAAVTS